MQFDNMFEKQLRELSTDQAWVLQVLGQHRSALLTTLETTLERARVGFVAQSLEHLRTAGLVECHQGIWRLTWMGTGVANWREQRVWLEMLPSGVTLAEPRDGENGLEIGPPCDQFRPALFAPGRCWCGRSRRDHLAASGRELRDGSQEAEKRALADG
ncbi:MAG: hypothetical protein U0931_38875 [Vulcanimicrobiota bacterium]